MAEIQRTCIIDGCEKPATAPRGWCWTHYGKWRRHGDPLGAFEQQPCSVIGCDEMSRVVGMCDMHYRRARKHGDPSKGARPVYGPTCAAPSCKRRTSQMGLCGPHYYQHWITDGDGKAVMAAASARRRARMAGARTDGARISWHTLWAEGERGCYLCGIECNIRDFRRIVNSAGRSQKIVGPTHPTLDHVVALAKGGAHTRDNVALACSECNKRKHTKANYEAQHVAADQAPRAHR